MCKFYFEETTKNKWINIHQSSFTYISVADIISAAKKKCYHWAVYYPMFVGLFFKFCFLDAAILKFFRISSFTILDFVRFVSVRSWKEHWEWRARVYREVNIGCQIIVRSFCTEYKSVNFIFILWKASWIFYSWKLLTRTVTGSLRAHSTNGTQRSEKIEKFEPTSYSERSPEANFLT